jgi:hypothetical protein
MGDAGNRIDSSGSIWSDYPPGFPQIHIDLEVFIAAIHTGSIMQHKIITGSINHQSEIFDIQGRHLTKLSVVTTPGVYIFSGRHGISPRHRALSIIPR